MCTDFDVTKNPRTLAQQLVTCDFDIVDLITNVVDAARRILFKDPLIGLLSPSGYRNSIFVFGSSINTTVTP